MPYAAETMSIAGMVKRGKRGGFYAILYCMPDVLYTMTERTMMILQQQ